MKWKKFFTFNKTRNIWFVVSLPLSGLLSLILLMFMEMGFRFHVPFLSYLVLSVIVSYVIGFIMDSLHSSLETPHHKKIFVVLKAVIAGFSILGLFALFAAAALSTVAIKKPAIYLYPTTDSVIDVKLEVNGRITQDIPKYNCGWRVFASKQGIIKENTAQFDYLFYEAELKNIELPNNGWIVEYSDLENWFDTRLPKLGLNEKELYQFKEYWMQELKPAKYYEIRLLSKEFLVNNMNLVIDPKPDTLIRLNFYFKPLDKPHELKEPIIVSPKREGFVVVEWGGILA
ncbi:MAG: hypothetical protein KKG59_07130 [Nanoarchaeota archaeon]|nr:hypothetical protein [Nanoarchaeota archaeon]